MSSDTQEEQFFFLFCFLPQNIYVVLRGDLYNTNVV